MCGRYAVYVSSEFISQFGVSQRSFEFQNYNAAPTNVLPVICELPDASRSLQLMRWGLTPLWQKTTKPLINARAETIHTKPSFRQAVLHRRCIVIANGYFEFKENNGLKYPYYIQPQSSLFAFAGVWERNIDKDPMDSFAIVTVAADEAVAPFHDRMPAILNAEQIATWLEPSRTNWTELSPLLKTYPSDALLVYPVSRKVNSSRYRESDTIIKIEEADK